MMFDAKLIRKSLQTREYYRFLTFYVATIGYTLAEQEGHGSQKKINKDPLISSK